MIAPLRQHSPSLKSFSFDEDEPVLRSYPLVGADGPIFGQHDRWDASMVPHAANVPKAALHLNFAVRDPVWNLRIREIAMALLNPTHPVVRRNDIFRRDRRLDIRTVNIRVMALGRLASYAAGHDFPAALDRWDQDLFDQYESHLIDAGTRRSMRELVAAARDLRTFAPVLTYGGLAFNPWDGRTATALSGTTRASGEVATPAIAPNVYWPLVRAAWTYIDVFSADILRARELHQDLLRRRAANPHYQRRGVLSQADATGRVEEWLARADSIVPTHSGVGRFGRNEGLVNWIAMDDMLFGGAKILGATATAWTQPLRDAVQRRADSGSSAVGCFGMACQTITRADGSEAPWHTDFDPASAIHEEYVLRAACYVFGLAFSAMRDSEWQELRKGALTEYFGAMAVRSKVSKGETIDGRAAHWWIIEPVARAISIVETLTWHDDHLWVTGRRPGRTASVGLPSADVIDLFIREVNANRLATGLAEIPAGRVRGHMFRRTFAVIAAQEPGAEIALGLLMKHASTRALSNVVTAGYYAEDSAWAREFDDQTLERSLDRLVELIVQRRDGSRVAAGPGANRMHQRLDRILSQASHTSRANVADER